MATTEFMPASFTIAGASAYTGFARSRLYDLIATGHLHPRRAGRRTILLRCELDDVIAGLPHALIRVRPPKHAA